ncbi:MAG: GGDEF domain-containing protein, partial [Actinomycetota bacterium]|nr:GGDEF domain-containing protein [Actinomycetota bacterium]
MSHPLDPASVEGFVAAVNGTMLVVAIAATVLTIGLLVWTVRSNAGRRTADERLRQDRRRPANPENRDPREALALVGDALAATHNPRVLLPIILEVIVEATGATGGQIFVAEEEVAWVGQVGTSPDDTLTLPLGLSTDGETTLRLHPPGRFPAETNELAEWLASQAAVALENARLHDVVQRQAITDDLTGLVNRRRFIGALQAEIERARRFGTQLTVLVADLDDFKRVNDAFGHHAGDDVLRSFADLVRSHVRDVDVPGRLGGEEFAILLPGTGSVDAVSVAERM